jgi:hypothetical protein
MRAMARWSGGLEPPEEQLLSCAESGKQYFPGPWAGQPMEDWGPERTIRAEVLRHLLVDAEWPVHDKGVEIRRARISGPLDLEGATVRWPLWLEHCYLDASAPVALDSATVPWLAFLGCRLAGISATTLVVTKGLSLNRSTLTGPVLLSNANITGGLRCHGTELTGEDSDGYALNGTQMTVTGGVSFTDSRSGYYTHPFTAAGAIKLDDADISGGLNCEGARLDGKDRDGFALVGFRMKVAGAMSLMRVRVSGAIGLVDADVTGALSCAGARISGHNEAQTSLLGDGIKVSSGAYLDRGFQVGGAVRLLDAIITGQLSFRAASISGKDPDGVSLTADRATVSGGVWLSDGFTAAGAIRLSGVSITGMLSCGGATLKGTDQSGNSLVGDGIIVSGDAYFSNGFKAAGTVNLRSASIGGSLSIMPAELAGGPDTVALDATAARIGYELRWEPDKPVPGRVILQDASANGLRDSWTDAKGVARPNGYWPSADQGQLLVNGFTYGRFVGSPLPMLKQRLAWIGSHPQRPAVKEGASFAPQPYEHLVQVYQQAGHDTEARKAAIARRRDLRWYGGLSRRRKAGNWLLDVTIGYGYETWRALVALAGLYAFVLVVFVIAQHQPALVVPSQSVAGLHPVPTARTCSVDYPCFYPAGYAIDTVIPLINIGQGGYWRPNASAPYGWTVEFVSWAGICLGWALATLIVAGYTGLARRVDNP